MGVEVNDDNADNEIAVEEGAGEEADVLYEEEVDAEIDRELKQQQKKQALEEKNKELESSAGGVFGDHRIASRFFFRLDRPKKHLPPNRWQTGISANEPGKRFCEVRQFLDDKNIQKTCSHTIYPPFNKKV